MGNCNLRLQIARDRSRQGGGGGAGYRDNNGGTRDGYYGGERNGSRDYGRGTDRSRGYEDRPRGFRERSRTPPRRRSPSYSREDRPVKYHDDRRERSVGRKY
eukprot:GHVR01095581.1.p1 GENE.GHVR01095581.1~~GHVR01095581.1.p1  ORF type:complete len:102 (+),score=24.17 GHVR01095581.1:304-609(+)